MSEQKNSGESPGAKGNGGANTGEMAKDQAGHPEHPEHPDKPDESKHPIEVVVNDKYTVTLIGKDQTGLSIKEAAIAQKVPIQVDFVLSIERGGGKTDIIGDHEPIKVKKGDRFLAIPDDDNS